MNYLALAATELLLLGGLAGIAGTLIVFRGRSFFAVALSHATFPGGVIFALAGWNLLIGQALFAGILVLVMGVLARTQARAQRNASGVSQGAQISSGIVLALGFALGTLLTSANPGLGVPVEALLVGSPLGVAQSDVVATALVLLVSGIAVLIYGRRILFHTFDPSGFEAAGFRSAPIEFVVTGVIAASVVVAMPAVGAILGVAILIAPAAAARELAPSIKWIPPLAALLGAVSGLGGLWISREFGLAAGGAIGLTATLVYVLALVAAALGRAVIRKRTRANFASVGAVECSEGE